MQVNKADSASSSEASKYDTRYQTCWIKKSAFSSGATKRLAWKLNVDRITDGFILLKSKTISSPYSKQKLHANTQKSKNKTSLQEKEPTRSSLQTGHHFLTRWKQFYNAAKKAYILLFSIQYKVLSDWT